MNCADDWIQASRATSDYFNLCYFKNVRVVPNAPLPGGGAGYAGFFNHPEVKEYIGACLNSPLRAGTQYTLIIHTAWGSAHRVLDLTIFGNPSCEEVHVSNWNRKLGDSRKHIG